MRRPRVAGGCAPYDTAEKKHMLSLRRARCVLSQRTRCRKVFPGQLAVAERCISFCICDIALLSVLCRFLWCGLGRGVGLRGKSCRRSSDSARATRRRFSAFDRGRRALSFANSSGCCMAICVRHPAAWYNSPHTRHWTSPKLRFLRWGFFGQ